MNYTKHAATLTLSNYKNITSSFWSDESFFAEVVSQKKMYGLVFEMFSDEIKENSTLVSRIFGAIPFDNDKNPLEFCGSDILLSEDIVKAAIQDDYNNINYFGDEIRSNVDLMTEVVEKSWIAAGFLKYFPDSVRDNYGIVLKILSKDPNSYVFVSKRLKSDKKVVYTAMFSSYLFTLAAYENSPLEVRTDTEFYNKIYEEVSKFKRGRGESLKGIDRIHKLALAELIGGSEQERIELIENLKYLKTQFIRNFSCMDKSEIEAFQEILKDKVSNFSNDKEIIRLAVKTDFYQSSSRHQPGSSISVINTSLFSEDDFLNELFTLSDGGVYRCLPEVYQLNENLILNHFMKIPVADIHQIHKKNKSLLIKLVRISAYKTLQIIDSSLYDDEIFVLEIAKSDVSIIEKASVRIKKNKKIISELIAVDANVLKHCEDSLLSDKDLVLEAFRYGGYRFVENLPISLLSDKEFVMSIPSEYDKYWEERGKGWRETPTDIVIKLVRSVSDELRKDIDFAVLYLAFNGWAINHINESIVYEYSVLKAAFSSGCDVYRDLDISKIKELHPDQWVEIVGSRIEDI